MSQHNPYFESVDPSGHIHSNCASDEIHYYVYTDVNDHGLRRAINGNSFMPYSYGIPLTFAKLMKLVSKFKPAAVENLFGAPVLNRRHFKDAACMHVFQYMMFVSNMKLAANPTAEPVVYTVGRGKNSGDFETQETVEQDVYAVINDNIALCNYAALVHFIPAFKYCDVNLFSIMQYSVLYGAGNSSVNIRKVVRCLLLKYYVPRAPVRPGACMDNLPYYDGVERRSLHNHIVVQYGPKKVTHHARTSGLMMYLLDCGLTFFRDDDTGEDHVHCEACACGDVDECCRGVPTCAMIVESYTSQMAVERTIGPHELKRHALVCKMVYSE